MKKFLITLLVLIFLPLISFGKPKQDSHIDVAFTIDNNYPIFTMIMIDSILQNSKSDYTFWIVENNITDKNKAKMRKFVEKDKNQKIEFININTDILDTGKDLFAFSNYITSIAFARILLPDLLPESVHKVLYLDSDMLVTSDLKYVYNYPLDGKIAGMVLNVVQDNNSLGLYKFENGYYNSGMILMDLDKCRKTNSSKKMFKFLQENKDKFVFDDQGVSGAKWLYPDQDLINIVWDGQIKKMPNKWNNQCIRGVPMVNINVYGIIHYIGPSKPWDFEGTGGYDYVKMYYKHWKNTQFSKYRYYYLYKKYEKSFIKMIKKKIRRYKNFFSKVKNRTQDDSIFWMFYVHEKMKR